MKVAIISSAYHPYTVGGGERSAQQLAENLFQQGLEVFVIAAHWHDQLDEVNGIPVYRVKSPNVYWSYDTERMPLYKKVIWHTLESYNPRTAGKVRPILEQEKPDLIQIRNYHNFSSAIWKIGNKLNIPVVQTVNDHTSLCYNANMFKYPKVCKTRCITCRMITLPRKYMSRYVSSVVGVSHYILQAHEKYGYFPHAEKSVVHTSPMANQPTALPLANNTFVTFGFIGRLYPIKGVAEMIKAFRQANVPGSRLLIAGAGPRGYTDQCEAQADDDPAIRFLGEMAPREFYPQVDVVIVPSILNEPFPRVVPEAVSYHRPVIVSNRGGISETVAPEIGKIFDADNFNTLSTIMKALSDNPSLVKKMHRAITTYVSQPSVTDVAQYIKIYQDTLAKKTVG